jgi:hypothetical protein
VSSFPHHPEDIDVTDDPEPNAADAEQTQKALAAFLDRLAALVAADVTAAAATPAEDRHDTTGRPSAG